MDENDQAEGSRIVCPSCTALCGEEAQFCDNCRAPITSYAATGPYESIFAEGAAYRAAFNDPTKLIVVIGVWFLFLPKALGGLCLVWTSFEYRWKDPDAFLLVTGVVLALLGSYILLKTTRNYLAYRRREGEA